MNRRALAVALAAAMLLPLAPAASAAVTCGGRRATHVGNNAANTIRGTGEMDTIVSYGGNDRVYGYASGDRSCLGRGRDWADLSDHTDHAWGGKGADTIYGRGGFDDLHGQVGDDTLIGGGGVDDLYGEDGDDHLIGTGTEDNFVWNEDYLNGGPGDDILDARGGIYNTLIGGTGYDRCYANEDNDPAYTAEDDTVRGCEVIHWS
ncbi:hypothetical protein BH20ACT9_BH20ACT9_21240 [soil metagenome]